MERGTLFVPPCCGGEQRVNSWFCFVTGLCCIMAADQALVAQFVEACVVQL